MKVVIHHASNRILEGTVSVLDRIAERVAPSTQAPHLKTGERGELAGFFYLREHGYVIVARRWHSSRRPGDIDLIGWDDTTLCFVEAKSRSSRDVATAEAAVDEHKQQTLCRLARQYLRHLPQQPDVRFDVLSVYYEDESTPAFELIRNAFSWC